MKYLFLVLVLFSSSLSFAHCPIPFVDNSGDYCMDLVWQTGDQKIKGVLEPVERLTPHLNRTGDIPQKWIYSKVLVQVWKNGDKTHVPVVLNNLRLFPYMTMLDGMHHAASSTLTYDSVAAGYMISGFSLQEMEGCWSLRASMDGNQDLATSVFLANIVDFQNLDVAEKSNVQNFCAAVSTAPVPSEAQGGHHHH